MTRVKGSTIHRARRKKVLDQAKGYFGSKHRLYKTAKEQVMHSGRYAYRDRKQKKQDFRKLWITRINAACRQNDISYSKFINGLAKAEVTINRKMLSEIAIDNPAAFTELVETAKKALDKVVSKKVKEAVVKTTVGKEAKHSVTPKPRKVQSLKPKKGSNTSASSKVKEENVDLSKLTVAELREIAKERELSGYSTMKKVELINALNQE